MGYLVFVFILFLKSNVLGQIDLFDSRGALPSLSQEININKNTTFDSTNSNNFTKNTTMNGNNYILTLNSANSITVAENVTLTITDLSIILNDPMAIKLLGDNSKLVLKNIFFYLGDLGITINTGSIEFQKFVTISSQRPTIVTPVNFTSKGSLSIGSNCTLTFNSGLNILFNPTRQSQTETLAQQKRRLLFTDSSSILNLNGCSFDASFVGVVFENGSVHLSGAVVFHLSNEDGKELEMLCSLNVFSFSILEIDGTIKR